MAHRSLHAPLVGWIGQFGEKGGGGGGGGRAQGWLSYIAVLPRRDLTAGEIFITTNTPLAVTILRHKNAINTGMLFHSFNSFVEIFSRKKYPYIVGYPNTEDIAHVHITALKLTFSNAASSVEFITCLSVALVTGWRRGENLLCSYGKGEEWSLPL